MPGGGKLVRFGGGKLARLLLESTAGGGRLPSDGGAGMSVMRS